MLLDAEARRRGGRRGERIFGMGASTEEEPKERGGSGEERATRNSAHFGVQHLADFGEQGVRGEWLLDGQERKKTRRASFWDGGLDGRGAKRTRRKRRRAGDEKLSPLRRPALGGLWRAGRPGRMPT